MAIDIYNNDIYVTGDDFIEGDGGVHNIRIMRNRGLNAAHTGLSAQPIFGGPAYYIRNVVYNTPVALKFSNPAGVIVYHNTIVAEDSTNQQVSNAHFANNLFLGTDSTDGIASLGGPTTYSTYDYDGFRPNKGVEQNYTWIGARPPALADYDASAAAAVQDARGAGGGHRPGDARHRNRLRHLRKPSTAEPATECRQLRQAIRGRRSEFQIEGRQQGCRCRDEDPQRQRRVRGSSPGPWRL